MGPVRRPNLPWYDAAGTVGALLVEKGGTVASKGGTIGYLNSAEGIATVTGSGSSWTVGTDGLVIGDRASGSLTVADSGTVITASEVTIGKAAGSTGTVAVTGAGSSLTVAGTGLFIAQDGTGSLTVANGGTVTSTADIIVGSPIPFDWHGDGRWHWLTARRRHEPCGPGQR